MVKGLCCINVFFIESKTPGSLLMSGESGARGLCHLWLQITCKTIKNQIIKVWVCYLVTVLLNWTTYIRLVCGHVRIKEQTPERHMFRTLGLDRVFKFYEQLHA